MEAPLLQPLLPSAVVGALRAVCSLFGQALKPYSFEKDGRFCFHGCHPASAAATEVTWPLVFCFLQGLAPLDCSQAEVWAETTCDRSVSANLKTLLARRFVFGSGGTEGLKFRVPF